MITDTENTSIISELTTDQSISSSEIEEKVNELNSQLTTDLNKLTNDALKEKCKLLGLNIVTRSKKPELIQSLIDEYMKLLPILKEKNRNDLKVILRNMGAKGLTSIKKEILIYQIMQICAKEMRFRLDDVSISDKNEKTPEIPVVTPEPPLSVMEELEKQKQEIEQKLQNELEKIRLAEEAKKLQEEEENKRIEEERKKKEKDDAKKKKQSIPKNVRAIVWNHYIGEDIIKHKCLCCKKVTITNTSFDVGHVLSEKNGGTHEINNLRPICFACNHSMSTENMIDFVVKYGLYIG